MKNILIVLIFNFGCCKVDNEIRNQNVKEKNLTLVGKDTIEWRREPGIPRSMSDYPGIPNSLLGKPGIPEILSGNPYHYKK